MKNPYIGKNIQPVYPPCSECLEMLDIGVLEWEQHVNREHINRVSGNITSMLGGETVPFITIKRDEFRGRKFCLLPVDITEIIAQMKDEIPAQYHYFLEVGVKLAVARTRQEMETLEKSK